MKSVLWLELGCEIIKFTYIQDKYELEAYAKYKRITSEMISHPDGPLNTKLNVVNSELKKNVVKMMSTNEQINVS